MRNRQVSGSEEGRAVLTSTTKTPARTTPRAGTFVKPGVLPARGMWPDQGVRPHKEGTSSYPGISIAKAAPQGVLPIEGQHISFTLLDRARPVFSFSFERKTGAPARPAAWGEEEGMERVESSPLGGDGTERNFFRRHGGCNGPAIAGRQSAPPARASTSPFPAWGITPTMRTALE